MMIDPTDFEDDEDDLMKAEKDYEDAAAEAAYEHRCRNQMDVDILTDLDDANPPF